jgi:hypothetical protein
MRSRTCQDLWVTDFGRRGCWFWLWLRGLPEGLRVLALWCGGSLTGASRGGRLHRSGLYAFVYGFAELD